MAEASSKPPDSRNRHSRLRRIAVVSAFVAVLCAGGWAGWTLREKTDDAPRPIIVRRTVTVVSDAGQDKNTAPSVVGLDEDAARQAFADAGAAPDSVKTTRRASVEAPGTVVEQDPAPAGRLDDGDDVTLVVASPAVVPDVVGRQEADARQAFEDLGATVRVVTRFKSGAEEGAVLSTRPAVGARLGPGVTIVVAEAESSVRLDQLDRLKTACQTDATRPVGGADQDGLLACPSDDSSTPAVDVDLGGWASSFSADLTLTDDAAGGASVRYRVLRDGGGVTTGVVRAGETVSLRESVDGARRLVVELDGGDEAPEAVFIDPLLSGSRTDIDRLSDASP